MGLTPPGVTPQLETGGAQFEDRKRITEFINSASDRIMTLRTTRQRSRSLGGKTGEQQDGVGSLAAAVIGAERGESGETNKVGSASLFNLWLEV